MIGALPTGEQRGGNAGRFDLRGRRRAAEAAPSGERLAGVFWEQPSESGGALDGDLQAATRGSTTLPDDERVLPVQQLSPTAAGSTAMVNSGRAAGSVRCCSQNQCSGGEQIGLSPAAPGGSERRRTAPSSFLPTSGFLHLCWSAACVDHFHTGELHEQLRTTLKSAFPQLNRAEQREHLTYFAPRPLLRFRSAQSSCEVGGVTSTRRQERSRECLRRATSRRRRHPQRTPTPLGQTQAEGRLINPGERIWLPH